MDKILVTRSSMPPMEEYIEEIKELWNNHWLTNMGVKHQQLEKSLKEYLDVDGISLFTNGHMGLELAIQAMNLTGEVITTPFTFASTTQAIVRNGLTPVFCDINPEDYTVDVEKLESLITDKTSAIIPVHVYGNVCNVEEIDRIAKKHGLKVIYDAAHTFGVKYKDRGIGSFGDASMFSFHATKVYNTIEGGALICHSAEMKYHVDNLKNFGFRGETTVVAPGINSKMDEMRAAYGLLNLRQVDAAIAARKMVAESYTDALRGVSGIRFFDDMVGVKHNYSYFPIFVNEELYGISRDALYEKMKANNVLGRRYFYPLITDFEPYNDIPSASPTNLPVANKIANQVICLPMHHALSEEDVKRVIDCVRG